MKKRIQFVSKSYNLKLSLFVLMVSISLVQCGNEVNLPIADSDNGGLYLPNDFEALVVVDSIKGKARHIAVTNNGTIYAKLKRSKDNMSIAALKDTNGDGRVDFIERFGNQPGGNYATEMRVYNGYIYFSTELVVYRYKLNPNTLVPEGEAEIVLTDDHPHGGHEHIGKPLAFDNDGHMYVPFGAPSNACQDPKRTPGAPGLDPCPQLEDHGGIWRFDANKIGQTQKDGYKYASGIRSVVAMSWNSQDNNLYVVMHGRDDLLRLFPNKYTPLESALLPSEEFMRVKEGSNFGWPYCYYNQIMEKKVLAPEYGGDGTIIGRCDQYDDPVMGFPGHWAPNDLVFYDGEQFPDRYKNGAFIAFHGSTNRAPYPQSGYIVAFVPFKDGVPSGEWEVFADGFASVDPIVSVGDAIYRPMGISVGPDGSLYLGDTEKGKIWRVMYKGDKDSFGEEQLAMMEERKQASNIRTPDEIKDNLKPMEQWEGGKKTYYTYCSVCHQDNGRGAGTRFPPLAGTDWVLGNKERLIEVLLKGLDGPVEVNGNTYNSMMPQHSFLSDQEIAEVLTYIRSNFGNSAGPIEAKEVGRVRKSI
ncbi:glucose/arabinose dehydrogenase/cytochrome c553 [Saonia flava]|uniref:Glucose/arabinose dehydrogenase/cytochrome c553 n=1 Tax=Saonia flava TaxID=523696 RepID=A0A846QVP5_9FLAO|nr:PQQ-dependent sugar dehydrogenase [Saonia flava]NJB70363.1 glucose/arabinose dehydrogenase/cytochrome c553 [Saonia flava]